jgi:SpoVK/Ycf46/Vps4 family AAA+-type ATPase
MQTIEKTSITPFNSSQAHLLAALALVDLRVRWAVVRARANGLNPQDEFRGLYIADDQVDQLLQFELGQHMWSQLNGHGLNGHAHQWQEAIVQARTTWQQQTQASLAAGITMRLEQLIQAFALTPIEVEAFLLVLAPDIDPRYAQIYAYLQDDVTRKRPSGDLLLNLLTDNFNQKLQLRSLLGENGRLIQCHLLHLSTDSNQSLLNQIVRPTPHIVAYLLDDDQLDQQLQSCAQLRQTADHTLPPRRISTQLIARLTQLAQAEPAPLFAFSGSYGSGKQEAAQYLAQSQPLLTVNLSALANSEAGLDKGMTLVLRDGRLHQATLYLTGWHNILENGRPPQKLFADLLAYPHIVIVASKQGWQPSNHLQRRPVFPVNFGAPDYDGRLHLWHSHLGSNSGLDLAALANQFRFTAGQIEDALATARDLAQWRGDDLSNEDLFAACRAHSNQNLATLATKIKPRYSWHDIVLPRDTNAQLQEMVQTVQHRPIVYGEWGFDRKLALGKGLSALFAGESGTGKTMAADIMAGELGLDLYKVDLSTLISKYIGETEKNLDRIFTEAATSNAILFFDEADAIFGKRSEVKDSHDRYANIEISYLLQRMEAYDGVVILATNLRANLDEAFTRRLHFAIEFPFPEMADRLRIWQVNVPAQTPISPQVNWHILAERFSLTGGNIRNIILAAAFLAANDGQSVHMAHLLHATRREYQKMGRLIDERLFELPVNSNP